MARSPSRARRLGPPLPPVHCFFAPCSPPAATPCLGPLATRFATCRQTDPFFQAHLAYAVSDCAGPPETGSSHDGRYDLEESPLPYQTAPAASSPHPGTFLSDLPTCQTCQLLQHISSGSREKRRGRRTERITTTHDDLRPHHDNDQLYPVTPEDRVDPFPFLSCRLLRCPSHLA